MIYGKDINMKCPNCGCEVEILRTRKHKQDRYVTHHPEGTCPAKYHLKAFRMTEDECELAYTRYRKELTQELK